MKLPPSPLIYEINTWPWLTELARLTGRPVDLASVPDDQWDAIAALGFDAVWLMGVWRRSPAGVAIARADKLLMEWFARSLDDFTDDDVVGSPYCVCDYVVDDHLGGDDALAVAREQLARRGVGLILDFVPNHVALDHPWTAQPEWFIRGSADDLERDPHSYVTVDGGAVLANGRDPHVPAWRDVVQVNAYAPGLRAAAADTLRQIAGRCDGVRCDMAMLMMNDIVERTWGAAAGPLPDEDYWPPIIDAVRDAHPDVVFIAEAYWDTEAALAAQGFDHCYDKTLYDVLAHHPARLASTLEADGRTPQRLLRFIENHDEDRAAVVFSDRDRMAAVTALTQAGARLVHQGQMEGRRARVPVQLRRFRDEPVDADRAVFYRALLAALADPVFSHGEWRLCDVRGSSDAVVAWERAGQTRWVVAVNVGDRPATLTLAGFADVPVVESPLTGEQVRVSPDGVLAVSLMAWGWQLYRARPGSGAAPVGRSD